jgi:hypothetical protein
MLPSRPWRCKRPPTSRRAAALLLGAFVWGPTACSTPPAPDEAGAAALIEAESEAQIAARERRADRSRIARLEGEIEQLTADLRQAEAAMLASDAEMSAGHSRANAASMLAEARIALEQAKRSAPWRGDAVEDARTKIAEGERQVGAGRSPAAVYLASRAKHIADSLIAEARSVEQAPDARFVRVERLNLRAGPSTDEVVLDVLRKGTPVFSQRTRADWLQVRTLGGEVGWVYASYVSRR